MAEVMAIIKSTERIGLLNNTSMKDKDRLGDTVLRPILSIRFVGDAFHLDVLLRS